MMTHEIGSHHTVVFIQQDGIGTPRSVPRNGRVPGIQIPGAPAPPRPTRAWARPCRCLLPLALAGGAQRSRAPPACSSGNPTPAGVEPVLKHARFRRAMPRCSLPLAHSCLFSVENACMRARSSSRRSTCEVSCTPKLRSCRELGPAVLW